MSETAKAAAYFDQLGAKHPGVDFELILERQRPGTLYLDTKEPLAVGKAGIFSLGRYGDLFQALAGVVLSCSQINPKFFKSEVIGLARGVLNQPFLGQTRNLTAELACAKIAASCQCGFISMTPPVASLPKDLVYWGDVRGALDQVAEVYGFKKEKWTFDPVKMQFLLLPGVIPGAAVKLDPLLINREVYHGVVMPIAPRIRPFLPIQHRGKDRVVDKVVFDGKTQTMTLTWADEH